MVVIIVLEFGAEESRHASAILVNGGMAQHQNPNIALETLAACAYLGVAGQG